MDDTLNQNTQEAIEESGSDNTILNVIFITVIMGMAIVGYVYGNFGSIPLEELRNDYVKKSTVTFNTMNANEKMNYIEKDKYLDEIDKLKNKKPKIVEKIIEVEKVVEKIVEVEKVVEKIVKVDKIVEKIVEVEKIVYKDKLIESEPKIIEKIVYKDKVIMSEPKIVYKDKIVQGKDKVVEKTVFKDVVIDKSKFNFFRCYGMSPSGYRLSDKCERGLKKFLDKNKDAKLFEVIGVMNPKDFRTIVILKQKLELLKKLDLSGEQVDVLKHLVAVGLDTLRVNETIWEVKKILGRKANIAPVSYDVNSKQYRGTVVRAYK